MTDLKDSKNNRPQIFYPPLHKPILVVNEPFKAPQRIMIAYDGSKAADKAIDMVATSPLYKGLTCHLVCVGKDATATEQLIQSVADKLTNAGGIEVLSKILLGKPDQLLCEYQDKHAIDMVVMGAFSHTRLHDLLLR